jgi:Lipase (class 3)
MKRRLIYLLSATLVTMTPVLHTAAQPKELSSVSLVTTSFSKKGTNAFSTAFQNNAIGRNDMDAYLLCYLTTLIYPQYLAVVAQNSSDSYVNRLHANATDFASEYKKYTSFLFSSPEYSFVHETFPGGYDPEAMVISTPQTIYVVFRGTDRVASNRVNTFMYDWGEWLTTDFDARYLSTPELTGKVLSGMWLSMIYNNFKDELLQAIKDKGGNSKKIWICGHSLGSGQAQLFAMFMAKKGITPQGVYVYAAPHPGTQEFVDDINRIFPNNRLQRFDFINDPITTLAPYVLGYRRAGTRVYYNDINSIQFGAPERSPVEAAALLPALNGAIANAAADFVSEKSNNRLKIDVISPGGSPFCYHHPLWYLRAAYSQLSADEREKVPAPLPLPDGNSEGCDFLTAQRGRTSNPMIIGGNLVKGAIDAGVAVVKETLEKIKFTADAIIDNVTGSALDAGSYYIKCYASESNLGLNEQDGFNNGSAMKLTTGKSKVRIERYGTIGYTIQFGTKTITSEFFGITSSETKEYVLDSKAEDLFDDGSTTVQLWERNAFPALSANQRWLLIKLKDNKYLIKNLANGKLLDANNACIGDNSCGVKTYKPLTDDQTQIWVLEKAN